MPNLTIYIPQELAIAVKRHNINVSRVCRGALERKVRVADRERRDELARARQAHLAGDDRQPA